MFQQQVFKFLPCRMFFFIFYKIWILKITSLYYFSEAQINLFILSKFSKNISVFEKWCNFIIIYYLIFVIINWSAQVPFRQKIVEFSITVQNDRSVETKLFLENSDSSTPSLCSFTTIQNSAHPSSRVSFKPGKWWRHKSIFSSVQLKNYQNFSRIFSHLFS